MVNRTALAEFFHHLEKATHGAILRDRYSISLYSTDASIYEVPPLGIFIPKSIDEIQAAVEIAAQMKIPILPRGAGTSLAGQAVNEALIIDTSRHCDQILEINGEEKYARVRPGVVLESLNLAAAKHGLKFGPDPASANRAVMGGIIGNNATGSHSIIYGMSVDHLRKMKVILSEGTITEFAPMSPEQVKFKQKLSGREGDIYRKIANLAEKKQEVIRNNTPKHWRRCGGYNLDRFVDGVNFHTARAAEFNLGNLVCGAEGTLAVMTEIEVDLVPLPQQTALAILQFPQHHAALEATEIVLQSQPDVVELFDGWCLQLTRKSRRFARMLDAVIEGVPQCLLIVEFSGKNLPELQSKIERLNHLLQSNVVPCSLTAVHEPAKQQNVWNLRKAGLGLLASRRGDFKPTPFIEDAAVPVSQLPEYISEIEKFCSEKGTELAYYAHASAGCLHVRPFLNLKNKLDRRFMRNLAEFSASLVRQQGGALSSEHGDGRSRSWLNRSFYGPALFDLFQQVKQVFDPDNIFNPGMITAGQSIDENLRFDGQHRRKTVDAALSFTEEGGLSGAVEMCTGAAVCKKRNSGSMCPSFMATREEKHSTRGRANALRTALNKGFPDALDQELYAVLDLCVECKACKSECPSKVDMAKLKFEFLHQYQAKHGVPLRSRLFAEIALFNRLFSGRLARLTNQIVQSTHFRNFLAKFFGITSQRKLPAFSKVTFERWFRHAQKNFASQQKKVVLFHDTFNACSQPEVLIAATKILQAAGFEIILSQHGCCGRSMISKGLLRRAKKMALQTVERLDRFALQNIPIVGLEPSCLLSLRDEYHDLLPQDQRVARVSENAFLFEEFVMQFVDTEKLQKKLQTRVQKVLLHGHCHQKALSDTNATKSFLQLIPGVSCEEIDSACCGMAGAFGYEKEHYEISLAMGELRLFPAVRAAAGEVKIAASGFSCRQQIEHGTGKKALHPVQIFAESLAND